MLLMISTNADFLSLDRFKSIIETFLVRCIDSRSRQLSICKTNTYISNQLLSGWNKAKLGSKLK